MYICICNALKEKELVAAAHDARTTAQVFRRCGRRPQCGKCLNEVAEIIENVRDASIAPNLIAAE